jgi:hypothetical protein
MHFRTPILVAIYLDFYLPNNNSTLSLDSPILLRLTHSDPTQVFKDAWNGNFVMKEELPNDILEKHG